MYMIKLSISKTSSKSGMTGGHHHEINMANWELVMMSA